MLKLFKLLIGILLISPMTTYAVDTEAYFTFRKFSQFHYDFEAIHNVASKTLTLKIGLVADKLPSRMLLEPISFTQAESADFVLLDLPDLNINCHEVVRYNFEYNPDIPYQLLMVTLRGEGCGNNLLRSPTTNTRIRFVNTPMSDGQKESYSLIIQ